MAGHRPVSSLCPSALGPQKVGVGVSPQKAFGCQWQAKRSACSTRGWVKSTSPVKRVTASQAHSALQGAVLWGYPAFPASSVEPSSIKTRTTAQIRPILAGRGRDAPPSQHRATQRPTGANGSEIARDAMIEKKRILLCHSISKPGRPQGPCRISPWNCGQRIIWWLTCICLLINQLCCGMTINSIFRFWVLLPEGTGHVPGAFWRL